MSAKSRKVTWVHSDKRRKRSYANIQALANALNVHYTTAWNYINKKGYTGDRDLKSAGRPSGEKSTVRNKGRKLLALRRALERNGIE